MVISRNRTPTLGFEWIWTDLDTVDILVTSRRAAAAPWDPATAVVTEGPFIKRRRPRRLGKNCCKIF